MDVSLQRLHRPDPLYRIETDAAGFSLLRAEAADRRQFDRLVRATLDRAGTDYVALPRSDGHSGYDGVYILPLT
jgi:hypothetical protein